MSRLRSNRTLHAFVFTVIFISLMIIGSSSWLIIYPTDTDTSTETPPDTSPYFISVIDRFDGAQHEPVPTPEGIEIFGTNGKYERNEEKGATTGYTLTWKKTVLRDDDDDDDNDKYFTALDSTLDPKFDLDAMKGCVAGTHYYEIVDNATGQVISKNHVLTIKPVTFTVTVDQGPVFTTADKPYVSITMTADDGSEVTVKHNHSFTRDNYVATTEIGYTYTNKGNVVPENTVKEFVPYIMVGNATAVNMNNYAVPTYDLNVTLLPTVKATATGKYYADLVQALGAETSGTVIPLQSFSYDSKTYTSSGTNSSGTNYKHVIDTDCAVQSGVLLYLPYDTSEGPTDVNAPSLSDSKAESSYGVAEYRLNEVTIKSGKKLTVNGTVYISGVVTAAQNGLNGSSLTSGNHAQINLKANSKIEAYNNIYCYGFIDGHGNGSSVEMNSGTMVVVYTAVEHRGGATYLGMIGGLKSDGTSNGQDGFSNAMLKNPKLVTSPFNRFFIRSITSDLVVPATASGGGTVSGYANLYAMSAYNPTVISLVSNTVDKTTSLIELSSGSKLKCSFDPDPDKTVTGEYGKNILDISGSASINSLSLTLVKTVAGQNIEVTLSTASVYFPLSHYWKVTLHPGSSGTSTFSSASQSIKLLPGSELNICEGVTLDINTNLVVFSEADHQYLVETGNGSYTYDVTTAAKLNVAGTLDVSGFGGIATPTGPNAKLIIGSAASLSTYEFKDATANGTVKVNIFITEIDTGLGNNVISYHTPTFTAKGDVYNGSSVSTGTLSANKEYSGYSYTKDGKTAYAWGIKKSLTITYNSNGGPSVDSKTPSFWEGEAVTIEGDLYPTLTRQHYTFAGWYTDSALTVLASGKSITTNTTLYAKWTPDPYTLSFRYEYDDSFDTHPALTAPTDQTFYVTDSSVPIPAVTSEYSFLGWFTSPDCTEATKIDAISGSELLNLTPVDGKYVLYGLWAANKYYTVTYSSLGSNNGKTVSCLEDTAITLISSERAGYEFLGWSDGTTTYAAGAQYTPTSDVTLTAQWRAYTVTYNANGGSCSTPSQTYAGTALSLPTPTLTGYRFLGWYTAASGGTKVGDAGASYTPTADATLYAQWIELYTVTYNANSGSVSPGSVDVDKGSSTTLPTPSRSGYSFNGWYTATSGGTKVGDAGASYTPTADVTLYAQWSRTCVTPDTLVTLADGTQKRIDEVTFSDAILVWNFFTGKLDVAYGSILMNHGFDDYDILRLNFSDGTTVKVISAHGFFDEAERDFVFITADNVEEYLGHTFLKNTDDGFVSVTLESYDITKEYTESYSILTAEHYNCMLENMFTVTEAEVHAIYLTPYDIGADLKYDEAKMMADIEKYGLYAYDEFDHLLTEAEFNALNLKHFKVAVGKGLITYDEILFLIDLHFGKP